MNLRAFSLLGLLMMSGGGRASDLDRALATEPTAQGAQAAMRVLRSYAERGDGEGGFAWWMKLQLPVRSRLTQWPELVLWRHRVEFLRDANRGDAASCAVSGRGVLGHPMVGCDYAAELSRYLRCTASLEAERRAEVLAALDPNRLDADAVRCGDSFAATIAAAREARAAAMN